MLVPHLQPLRVSPSGAILVWGECGWEGFLPRVLITHFWALKGPSMHFGSDGRLGPFKGPLLVVALVGARGDLTLILIVIFYAISVARAVGALTASETSF